MPGRRHLLAGALAGLLAGCGTEDSPDPSSPETGSPPATAGSVSGFTHQRATGNRVVPGTGRLPDVDPLDVEVEGTPAWIVGIPAGDASAWAVVTEAGDVVGLRLADRTVERFDLEPGPLPEGSPPLLIGGDPPAVAAGPARDASDRTHPYPSGRAGCTSPGTGTSSCGTVGRSTDSRSTLFRTPAS